MIILLLNIFKYVKNFLENIRLKIWVYITKMVDFFIDSEMIVRFGFFLGVLTILAAIECIIPRRTLTQSKAVRWYSNLGIVILNSVLVSIIFPLMPIALAVIASERSWGYL